MGCFSWEYADCENKKALNIGKSGYLLNPFGENYFESYYDGYGRFAGHDVYDLVADWNKEFIPIMLQYVDHNKWVCSVSENDRKNLMAFYNNKPIDCEKRWIGIMMACYDEDNKKLFYPIKITKTDVPYDSVNPSESDINQGFGDDEDYDY